MRAVYVVAFLLAAAVCTEAAYEPSQTTKISEGVSGCAERFPHVHGGLHAPPCRTCIACKHASRKAFGKTLRLRFCSQGKEEKTAPVAFRYMVKPDQREVGDDPYPPLSLRQTQSQGACAVQTRSFLHKIQGVQPTVHVEGVWGRGACSAVLAWVGWI